MTERAVRGQQVAIREIRAAEAARMLGLLDVATLPDHARQWLADGITAPSAGALAVLTAGHQAGGDNRVELLAALAADCGIHFSGLDDARAVHAESVIGIMATGGDFPRAVFEFSNNYTDHLTGRLSGLLRRSFRRRT